MLPVPKRCVFEIIETGVSHQNVYTGGRTAFYVFSDRALWNFSYVYGLDTPEITNQVRAEIAKIKGRATVPLYCTNLGTGIVDSTYGAAVASYDIVNETIQFAISQTPNAGPGDCIQMGRYVLKVIQKSGGLFSFENFPGDITWDDADPVTFNMGLTVQAQLIAHNPPPLAIRSANVWEIGDISFVEVP